jgi:hypothetical protein
MRAPWIIGAEQVRVAGWGEACRRVCAERIDRCEAAGEDRGEHEDQQDDRSGNAKRIAAGEKRDLATPGRSGGRRRLGESGTHSEYRMRGSTSM